MNLSFHLAPSLSTGTGQRLSTSPVNILQAVNRQGIVRDSPRKLQNIVKRLKDIRRIQVVSHAIHDQRATHPTMLRTKGIDAKIEFCHMALIFPLLYEQFLRSPR